MFFDASLLKKIFAAMLSTVVLVSVSATVSSIVSTIYKSDLAVIYEEKSGERVVTIIFVQILLIVCYDLILRYSVTSLKRKEWKLILSVLGISFISMVCVHAALIKITIDYHNARLIMASEFGLIILNVVCFYMTYTLSRSNAETEELRLKQQQDEYRSNYADNIKNQYEEMRRTRYDMKQSLAVISALCNEGKYDEVNQYINKVSDNLAKLEMIIDVGNDFINAILNTKLSIAHEKGIKVICSSVNNISGIDDIDLCNLLGNMLDNAMEAAERCTNSLIEVSIHSDDDKVLAVISNSVSEPILVKIRS